MKFGTYTDRGVWLLLAAPLNYSTQFLLTCCAHSGHQSGHHFTVQDYTCAGRPGARGHEVIDAQTYAEWGVDYLKEDSCHARNDPSDGYRE